MHATLSDINTNSGRKSGNHSNSKFITVIAEVCRVYNTHITGMQTFSRVVCVGLVNIVYQSVALILDVLVSVRVIKRYDLEACDARCMV